MKGGEKIAVDGVIESGESTVSEAILTGESEPVHKKKGDSVLAGSTNGDGLLIVKTVKVGSETMLMRVAGNVKQIQEDKPFLLTIFDKVIDKYVLTVLVLAGITVAGWIAFNAITGANMWLQIVFATLSVLVIGYPCAIGLSTPPVKLRALSIAADKGVLVNDATSFLPITRADTIVLDKTGTITEGRPSVNEILTFDNSNEALVLEHAASIEMGSSHPISKAIVEEAKKRGLNPKAALDTKQIPGKGVIGSYNGHAVVIGTHQLLEEQGMVVPEELSKKIEAIDSPVLMAFNGKLEGVLGISDTMRKGIGSIITQLIHKGYKIVMLTGDAKKAAEKIASKLGIQYEARMSPMEKANYIKMLQELHDKKIVIAIGDGVNDAPALAQADVGIAVGSGIDISKETASFVLLTDDIGIIPTLVSLGKKYNGTIKRNILLALGFNAVGIPIAAMGLLNPFIAMTIMIVDVAAVFASTWFLRSTNTITLNNQDVRSKS